MSIWCPEGQALGQGFFLEEQDSSRWKEAGEERMQAKEGAFTVNHTKRHERFS